MSYNQYLPRGTNPSYSTAAANGVNPLIPVEVQQQIVQGVAEKSGVLKLARKIKMGTQLKVLPVLDVNPTAYWVTGDTGLKQTTRMDWRNVVLTAEEIAVLIPIPDVVFSDASIDLWEQIRPKVEEAFGVALDAAVLFGTNKPSSWPTAIGTAAIAAGNTVTHGAGVDVAADINNVMGATEADGYEVNGHLMRQTLRATLRGLRDTTNGFIFKPGEPGAENSSFGRGNGARQGTIFDVDAYALKNGVFEAEDTASANAVELVAGDWEQVIIGIREDITMDRSNSAVIQDASGAIVFNAYQQDLTIARFKARYAMAVPNPTNRTNSATATRYPFSVLRMAA